MCCGVIHYTPNRMHSQAVHWTVQKNNRDQKEKKKKRDRHENRVRCTARQVNEKKTTK